MESLRGIAYPALILMGLIAGVILMLLFFKMVGLFNAYSYEEQSQVTAKNMQTAMNMVCVTGETQYISVNMPQKVSSSAVASSPWQMTKALASGDAEATADALRYTFALDSFGDPWYVIYFERFPEGEDSGWSGWSEIASQRLASNILWHYDNALCAAAAATPYMGDLARLSKRAGGFAQDVTHTRKAVRFAIEHTKTAKSMLLTAPGISESVWMANMARHMSPGSYPNLGRVYRSFVSDSVDANRVSIHLIAVEKSDALLKESRSSLARLKGLGVGGADNMLENIGALGSGKKLTEKAYKDGLGAVSGSNAELFSASSSALEAKKAGLGISDGTMDGEYIAKLIDRAKYGDITSEDIGSLNNMRKSLGKEGNKDWDEFISIAENTRVVGENTAKLSADALAPNSAFLARESVSIDDSYAFLQFGRTTERPMGNQAVAAYYTKHMSDYYRLMSGTDSAYKVAGKALVSREGQWVLTSKGLSFIFNTVAMDTLKMAESKFYTCSENALCMKSAVDPAIHVYPLDDCEAVGIKYVELDKEPEGLSLTDTTFAKTNSVADYILGSKSSSRFYAASPCLGKMKIEKTECGCEFERIPYIDFYDSEARDMLILECVLKEKETYEEDNIEVIIKAEMDCSFFKNRTYLGEFAPLEPVFAGNERFDQVFRVDYNSEKYRHDIVVDLMQDGVGGRSPRVIFGDYYRVLGEDFRDIGGEVEFKVTASFTQLGVGEKIRFSPIYLPAIQYYYSTCDGTSSLWLKCNNWTKIGEDSIEQKGLKETKRTPANVWGCNEWNLTDLTNDESVLALKAESYDEYRILLSGNMGDKIDKDAIKNMVAFFGKDEYLEKVLEEIEKLVRSKAAHEVTLPKLSGLSDPATKEPIPIDPNIDQGDEGFGKLFWHNMPSDKKTDCLKISYVAAEGDNEATKGFCYSSPTAAYGIQYGAILAGATIIDIGMEVAIDSFTAGMGKISGLSSISSCIAGNMVFRAGENMISKKMQANYWPNNAYFGNYFT
jgi:hypothetical protein